MNQIRSPSPRLFYALWPDDDTRAALKQLQNRMSGRLTLYGNLHLTLAFLGSQPADRLPLLEKITAALPAAGFELMFDRIGYFTHRRIAWAGMQRAPDALLTLRRALTARLLESGIAFDSHPEFRPHVTLARDAEPPEDFPFAPVMWRTNEIALLESVMQPEGVVYRVLQKKNRGMFT